MSGRGDRHLLYFLLTAFRGIWDNVNNDIFGLTTSNLVIFFECNKITVCVFLSSSLSSHTIVLPDTVVFLSGSLAQRKPGMVMTSLS